MRVYDLIMKKRNGGELSTAEINYLIENYVSGAVADYQMSALLMAIYFRGMTEGETLAMTEAVARSGDMMDLSSISGIKVDKHSTGGVGDKTTLIVAPIVAACGVKLAKMSGRGLGHTGGTVDKLEAIPGLRTEIGRDEFLEIVNKVGFSIIAQSGNITPADKLLYALRDVTATVDSVPLIAVSIMSKKLAAGSDCILLDVKTGSGAFMKTLDDALDLAKEMVTIGENAGRKTMALISNMDEPLGCNIGNSLELVEVIATLRGQGPEDLTELCLVLATDLLRLAGKGTEAECRAMAEQVVADGSALESLAAMVTAQGGDASVVRDPQLFKQAECKYEFKSKQAGYIAAMDTEQCGIASTMLGAGRERKESVIDFAAGIVLHKKTGDYVEAGELVATLYAAKEDLFPAAADKLAESIGYMEQAPVKQPLIYAKVTQGNVEYFTK